MDDTDHMTHRQRLYSENLARGMALRAAARAAGYSESFSRVAAHRLGKIPSVVRTKASIQAEGMKLAVYDLACAMQEAAEVIEFAKQHKHPTACFFAVRHRAHLSGLLVDKIQLETTVDLKGALAEARGRVFTIMTVTPGHGQELVSAVRTLTAARTPDNGDKVFGD